MSSQKDFVPRTIYTASSDPSVEPAGSIYYNTSTSKIRVSDGVSWSDAGGSAGSQKTFAFFVGG